MKKTINLTHIIIALIFGASIVFVSYLNYKYRLKTLAVSRGMGHRFDIHHKMKYFMFSDKKEEMSPELKVCWITLKKKYDETTLKEMYINKDEQGISEVDKWIDTCMQEKGETGD